MFNLTMDKQEKAILALDGFREDFFLYTTFVTFATLNPFYTCLKENVRKMPKSFGMMSWSTAAYKQYQTTIEFHTVFFT